MSEPTQVQALRNASSEDGKHLSFELAGGLFAVQITRVREIIAMHPITPVPGMSEAVRGVINLRGKIIPVIDLRMHLSLAAAAYDRSTCIIVFDIRIADATTQVGCIVDAVSEVTNLAQDQIQAPPKLQGGANLDHVTGLAKTTAGDKVVTLLAIDTLLQSLVNTDSLATQQVA